MTFSVLLAALFALTAPGLVQYSCPPVDHAFDDYPRLNRFWGVGVSLCRLGPGTNNAYADRQAGAVWADQDWLDGVPKRHGNWAATGILAHEWGHIVQGNVEGGAAAELQADCLAGVYFKGMGLPLGAINQYVDVNWSEGGDQFLSLDGHGTGQQRVNAARKGYNGFAGQQGPALQALCPRSFIYYL
jgi:hypothetical protein